MTSGDLGLSQADPDAFLVESARLDPPVTSVSAIAPEGGQQLQGPGGGQLRVEQGVPMQLLLSHAGFFALRLLERTAFLFLRSWSVGA